MSTLTVGASGQPSQLVKNFDALFSLSLANYRKQLSDEISKTNAVFYELKNSGMWKVEEGSTLIKVPLMYQLNSLEPYDGYDELGDTPINGVTEAIYEWRQASTAITYSMKELKQNKHKLVDLVDTKMKQAEMGMQESFNKLFLQGQLGKSGAGNLYDPAQSASNGALFVDPLFNMVRYDPTASASIGNINQADYTWWRNRKKECSATTYTAFLLELDNLYNTCARGPGGPPNLILTDQTTYELINAVYYHRYRTMAGSDANYPFENIKFRGARIVWDEEVPDVYSNLTNTDTYGTIAMLNTKFLEMRVESDTNFAFTGFQKPPKGDSRLGHILLMAQTVISNRRKHGVMGKVPRTLTAS